MDSPNVGLIAIIAITGLLLFYSGMLFNPRLIRHQLQAAQLRDLGKLIVANYVMIPLATLAIIGLFDFSPVLNLVLLIMAMMPCAALVPPLVSLVGEAVQRPLFAFVVMSLLNIASTPAILALLKLHWVGQGELTPYGGEIVAVLKYVVAVFIPMSLGATFRVLAPRSATLWQTRLLRLIRWLMPLTAVLFCYQYREHLMLLGWRDLQALLTFEAICIAIGAMAARNNPEQRTGTILISALRNTAMGLAFALVAFPHTMAPLYMLIFITLSFLGALLALGIQRRIQVVKAGPGHEEKVESKSPAENPNLY